MKEPGNALPRRVRGDVDDLSVVLFLHMGIDGPAAEPYPAYVDVEGLVPFVHVELMERSTLHLLEVGGVVDQYVDATEALRGGSGHRLRRVLVADVDVDGRA